MRVLLIQPPYDALTGGFHMYYPVGLVALASSLRSSGVDVAILDCDMMPTVSAMRYDDPYEGEGNYLQIVRDPRHRAWQWVKDRIIQFAPDLVGVSSMTTCFASAVRVTEVCKEVAPRAPVIMGGAHATIDPKGVCAIDTVDAAIQGEGEVSFASVIKWLQTGDKDYVHRLHDTPPGIAGLWARTYKGVTGTAPGPVIKDLDALPFDGRSLLQEEHLYTPSAMGVIMTSRGCPYNCAYCYHPWHKALNYRTVTNVLDEIGLVHERYGTTQFDFKDDSFTVRRSHIIELCEGILQLGFQINFGCTTRVDIIDSKLLRLMMRAGLNKISVGIESGSPRILEATNKGITMDQVRQTAKLFNTAGVYWTGYFMAGLPMESEKDIQATCDFRKELGVPYAGLGLYKAFPGTRLFNRGVELGLLSDNVPLQHFFERLPKHYYFKDPTRRSTEIVPERTAQVLERAWRIFYQENKRLSGLVQRAWARRLVYRRDPSQFLLDIKRAVTWLK